MVRPRWLRKLYLSLAAPNQLLARESVSFLIGGFLCFVFQVPCVGQHLTQVIVLLVWKDGLTLLSCQVLFSLVYFRRPLTVVLRAVVSPHYDDATCIFRVSLLAPSLLSPLTLTLTAITTITGGHS